MWRWEYSYNYNKPSLVNTGYEYKENTAGKIDVDTSTNNTKGSLLAVRWDHWRMGFRRRPVVGFLPRDNPINVYLGRMRKKKKSA